MEDACEMLDRPFSLSGTVIHGKAIGHTIGFATMNLVWPEDKLLVPIGVYLSKVKIGETHIRQLQMLVIAQQLKKMLQNLIYF